MDYKIFKYRMRRYKRILSRMDADDEEGRWVTTENNHHVHINENGEPDMGNPYVIAAMTGKPPRVGMSERQRRITSLVGKTGAKGKISEELSEMPPKSMIMVRTSDGWRGKGVDIFVKDNGGYFVSKTNGEAKDADEMARLFNSEDDESEFDLFEPDEVRGFSVSGGKKTKDIKKLASTHRLYTWSGRSEFLDDVERTFETAPFGTRIEFPGDGGRWRKKKKGDSEVWVRSVTKEEATTEEMRSVFEEKAFGDFTGIRTGFKYSEPVSDRGKSFSEGHKVFTDKHDPGWLGSHQYEGDGQKTVEYFSQKSNCDNLIYNMNTRQISAFKHWTQGDFMSGEQHKGWDNMDYRQQQWTRSMDEILDQARLDEPIVVSRLSNASLVLGKGNKQPLLSELRAMKGKKVISRGAMSCGAAAEGLTIGSGHKMVEYRISVPAGTGYGMWVGNHRINDWGSQQREFVLNRDAQYEVGETTFDPERNVFVVELKMGRLLEHDYGSEGE